MNLIAFFLLIICAFALADDDDFDDITEAKYIEVSEECFRKERVPERYASKFAEFDYPDELIVLRYLHCVYEELDLWDDDDGFNVRYLADLHKDREDARTLLPMLKKCNRNCKNNPPLRWLYSSFSCLLNNRIGEWFKEDIRNYLNYCS